MSLVNELIKGLLPEEEKKKVVAVYGGGFKPPTSGHFEVVKQALKENPEIDEMVILIGGKPRNGITPDESILIWDIYKQYLPFKVEVKYTSVPPIKGIYNYAKEHPDEEVLFIIGAREGNEEDFKDIASRTKSLDKYPNLNLRTIVTQGGVSGTAARNASKISLDKFKPFVPSELSDEEVEQVFNIVADKIQENDPEDGKAAPYGSGYKKLNENASYSQHIDVMEKIAQLTNHMIDKGMNIEPLPTMEFVDGDSENASDFFGKTAYYDPNKQHIVLYTEGRHPKDIVRSYAHEMIHHIQYLEDRLGDVAGTDTTEDNHLDKIEQEANLRGTMTFRNWTDSILNEIGDLSQVPYKWKTFPKPEGSNDPYSYYDFSTDNGTKYQVIFNREEFGKTVNYDMSFVAKGKDGKDFSADALTGDNEPFKIMSTIVDITRDQIKKAGDVEFITFEPTKGKTGEEGAKGNTRSKLYKIIIKKNFPKAKVSGTDTVVVDMTAYKSNDLKEAIVGEKIECDNCGWSWNIVDGGDDLFICHKCGHDNEPISEKKNKDPFGINAYARELGRLNEKVMDYKIYCDMDGVLADFESGYEELTGIDLRGEFQKGDDFWDPISKAGVGFWAGLKWMPDGQKLWDYLKPFDPVLLSAPSREDSSRIGKHVWVKHKIPGTKLILRYASQKQELATPESILIDDRQVNIDQWEAAGGIGILHTSTANTIQQLQTIRFMSKDTVLKKEFQKKDVERLRNLMQGKYGEKTRSSVGFTNPQEFYNEGDIWESDGRTWTITNGIKQNITKLDKAKKAHTMPLFCPKCGKLMKRVDKPYYNVHKYCLSCHARAEDKLKAEGNYEEHYNKINNKIIDSRIEDFKQYINEKLDESNNSFVSENGEVEKWVGKLDPDKVEEYTKQAIQLLEGMKTKK